MRISDWSSDVCSSDQAGAPLGPLAVLGAVLGNLQAGLGGQALDRLGKAEAFGIHHEVDGAAVRAAAEAVVEALLVDDREGGRLLVVEGTRTEGRRVGEE